MLGSVGVIVGALIITFTGFYIADPIIAVLIGLWVLPRTWILLREAGNVLMEGAPRGIDTEQVRAALLATPGVAALHDLHVWALSSTKPALAAHVVAEEDASDGDALRIQLEQLLEARFEIHHVTLQIEATPCGPGCEKGNG
jgi:cobalt-zinc-cadmium efflux system protein